MISTSALFEPYAIWFNIFFLLIAIWFKFTPLIIVSTFLSLLFIIINKWKKISLLHVEPDIQLSKNRLFPDEEFEIYTSVYNGKWFPLVWLEWSFPKYEGICFGEDEENVYTIRFLWLMWYKKVKWILNCKALRRGVYDIGQVTLHSGDGFRFAETEQLYSLDGKLYIYPKLLPVNVNNFRTSVHIGANGKQGGFIEDPLLVIGIREYQTGDEMKRINWRATSRTGKLQVNTYQPVVMEQLIIYIDVKGFEINENKYENQIEQKAYIIENNKIFERSLSIIASIGMKYKEQGISIGFASNGLNYVGEKMSGKSPSTNLTPFLDSLAQITNKTSVKNMSLLDEMLYRKSIYSPLYIFCEQITRSHYQWYQQNKNKLSHICFYYVKESKYDKKLATMAKSIDTFILSTDSSEGSSYYA